MKIKEKWAEETNPYDDVHDDEESGVWPEAWLAGFEFAKKECGKLHGLMEFGQANALDELEYEELGEEEI